VNREVFKKRTRARPGKVFNHKTGRSLDRKPDSGIEVRPTGRRDGLFDRNRLYGHSTEQSFQDQRAKERSLKGKRKLTKAGKVRGRMDIFLPEAQKRFEVGSCGKRQSSERGWRSGVEKGISFLLRKSDCYLQRRSERAAKKNSVVSGRYNVDN